MRDQTQQAIQLPLPTQAAALSLRFDEKSGRWTHFHDDADDGILVLIAPDIVQCEKCKHLFILTPPDENWDRRREGRVDEVLSRLRETDNPDVWECHSKTPRDGRIYRIEFDSVVRHWRCNCRDYRDHADRFWKCKHVRRVQRMTGKIA